MLHFFSKTKEKQLKISLFYTCTKNLDMIYSSWDIECDRLKLVILGHFLPFYSPKNPKKVEILKKWKNTWRYHFALVYDKWPSYDVWFLRYGMRWTDFFCHFGPFFAFLPPNNPKNHNFGKMKKRLGDIIILYNCTKNHDHMLHWSWDTAHEM